MIKQDERSSDLWVIHRGQCEVTYNGQVVCSVFIIIIWQFQGDRVTVAAGIRLSTRKVYKVGTLEGKLTGIVHLDLEFDIANRSGRSRAIRSCRETVQNLQKPHMIIFIDSFDFSQILCASWHPLPPISSSLSQEQPDQVYPPFIFKLSP